MEFTLNVVGKETFNSLRAANEAARKVVSDCEAAVFAKEIETGWKIPVGFKAGSIIVIINEQHTDVM